MNNIEIKHISLRDKDVYRMIFTDGRLAEITPVEQEHKDVCIEKNLNVRN